MMKIENKTVCLFLLMPMHRRQPSIYENKLNIPAQNNPFPTKPVLHVHTNEPKVLAQLPWTLHGLPKHSFISKIQRFCRLYAL